MHKRARFSIIASACASHSFAERECLCVACVSDFGVCVISIDCGCVARASSLPPSLPRSAMVSLCCLHCRPQCCPRRGSCCSPLPRAGDGPLPRAHARAHDPWCALILCAARALWLVVAEVTADEGRSLCCCVRCGLVRVHPGLPSSRALPPASALCVFLCDECCSSVCSVPALPSSIRPRVDHTG